MNAWDGKTAAAGGLRDADELLEAAVRETIDALTTTAEDAAVIRLAITYAQTIDACAEREWAARWLMPLLLDALGELSATPAARARLKTGKTADAPAGQLARLRATRRA